MRIFMQRCRSLAVSPAASGQGWSSSKVVVTVDDLLVADQCVRHIVPATVLSTVTAEDFRFASTNSATLGGISFVPIADFTSD